MSREEAATVYLDVLLGYRGDYGKFREAEETLTDRDKALLRHAVVRHPGTEAGVKKAAPGGYFWRIK
jgi:hypothetical protein